MATSYVSIVTFLAVFAPLVSVAADLRVGLTRYEGGAAIYGLADNQQLICDNRCPEIPDLVLAPPRPAIRFEPPIEHRPWIPADVQEVDEAVTRIEVRPLAAVPARITIYFPFDKARLGAGEKKRIKEALAAGLDPSVIVRVDGYTCRVGSEAYNRNLSARRAKAVAAYLKTLGVKVASVEGLGKKHHTGAVVPKDRKAEIIVRERD